MLAADAFTCAGGFDERGGADGEPVAVAFDPSGSLVVQLREPAALVCKGARISIGSGSVFDAGHAVFHANAGGFIACASCQAEGGDDDFTWTFDGIGPRRTQTSRGGLSGTEPFHWDGDVTDLSMLMTHVFVGRMSGRPLDDGQLGAVLNWIDGSPRFGKAAPATDDARGKALFDSDAVGCAGCHAGPTSTNNTTVDAGTGGTFQVPSLRDVAFRAPYIHDGCAKNPHLDRVRAAPRRSPGSDVPTARRDARHRDPRVSRARRPASVPRERRRRRSRARW